MKKFFALFLALMLVLSMSSVAWAATDPNAGKDDNFVDEPTVTVTKKYKLIGAGANPAETFTLQQIGDGKVTAGEATEAPDLVSIVGAKFAEGEATADGVEKDITITLPTYSRVGVYEYLLREVATNNKAGVYYYGDDISLIVTVIEQNGEIRVAAVHTESGEEGDKEKRDTFTNTYSAGSLIVTKTVAGNMGDQEKAFQFHVAFTKEANKNFDSTIKYSVNGAEPIEITPEWNTEGVWTYDFTLAHDDSIKFINLPYNVAYVVTEDSYSPDYETTKSGDMGTINAAEQTAAFTNTYNTGVDTGITTDSMPYVLLMGMALVGIALMLKRRAAHND